MEDDSDNDNDDDVDDVDDDDGDKDDDDDDDSICSLEGVFILRDNIWPRGPTTWSQRVPKMMLKGSKMEALGVPGRPLGPLGGSWVAIM